MLRLCVSKPGGVGSIPGQKTEILYSAGCNQKKKKLRKGTVIKRRKSSGTKCPPLLCSDTKSRNRLLVTTQVVLEAGFPFHQDFPHHTGPRLRCWQKEWKSHEKCDLRKEELTGFGK